MKTAEYSFAVLVLVLLVCAGCQGESVPAAPASRYVANIRTSIVHKVNCRWAEAISADNRLPMSSLAEAQVAGYRPCRVCLAGATMPAPETRRIP